jgi:hypothetical protein
MSANATFEILVRVVQPMPISPRVGESVDLAVEQVEVLESTAGGPTVGTLLAVAHANAPADAAARQVGAMRRLLVRRTLPPHAVLWAQTKVNEAEVWYCVRWLGDAFEGRQ